MPDNEEQIAAPTLDVVTCWRCRCAMELIQPATEDGAPRARVPQGMLTGGLIPALAGAPEPDEADDLDGTLWKCPSCENTSKDNLKRCRCGLICVDYNWAHQVPENAPEAPVSLLTYADDQQQAGGCTDCVSCGICDQPIKTHDYTWEVKAGRVSRTTYFHRSCFLPQLELRRAQQQQASEWFTRGLEHQRQEQWEAAAGAFAEAVRAEPESGDNYLHLAAMHDRLGQLEKAVEVCMEGLTNDPDCARLYFNMAHYCARLNQDEEAVEAYRRYIALEPRKVEAYHDLGTCLIRLNRGREAVSALEQALEISPEHPQVLRALAVALSMVEREVEAVSVYERLVAREPEDAGLWDGLGTACTQAYDRVSTPAAARAGPPPEGVQSEDGEQADQPVALTPQGYLARALAAYQQGSELEPRNPAHYVGIGMVYALMGKLEAAYEQAELVGELDPGQREALLQIIKGSDAYQQREEDRRQEQQRAAEAETQRLIAAGLCLTCGKPMGLMDKISGRHTHKQCVAPSPAENSL